MLIQHHNNNIFVWSNRFLIMEIFIFFYMKFYQFKKNMNLIILLMEWWIDDVKNLYKFFPFEY